jgi:hypothetical protein
MQLETEAAFSSVIAVTFIFVLIGVCLSFTSARPPKLTGIVQKNVLRHRRALPNGDWRLLRGPADIYMVRSEFYSLFESHISRSCDSFPFLYTISCKR